MGAPLRFAFDESQRWGAGSDLFCPARQRLVLDTLNGTHDIALNLFCVDRPQLLIVTLDSYRRQHQPLQRDDFLVALEVLRRYPNMYVIYNCGEAGGCSRVHKHLQALRGPPYAFEFLTAETSEAKAPFRYLSHRFPLGFGSTSAADMLRVYGTLLEQSRALLEITEADICPHNMVLWMDWIIIIPRRSGSVQGASTNTIGMMGSIWVSEQKQIDEWLRIGCAEVLRGLGVPA